jgi:hypothetical protein
MGKLNLKVQEVELRDRREKMVKELRRGACREF